MLHRKSLKKSSILKKTDKYWYYAFRMMFHWMDIKNIWYHNPPLHLWLQQKRNFDKLRLKRYLKYLQACVGSGVEFQMYCREIFSRVTKGRTENGKFQKVRVEKHVNILLNGLKLQDDDGVEVAWLISLCLKGLMCESEAWQLQSLIVAASSFSITGHPSLWRVTRHWHWLPREVSGSPSWR